VGGGQNEFARRPAESTRKIFAIFQTSSLVTTQAIYLCRAKWRSNNQINRQRRLVSMQNGSLHYFFSYLTDFDVVMRKLISE
jgi:hypothetical protein